MEQSVPILASIPWYAWVAIVAIICGTVSKLIAMSHRHRERMMMIQAGMRPDEAADPRACGGYVKPAVTQDEV
jgi:hypothetical protein